MTVEKCQCWQRTRNPKKPAGKCDGQELSALTQEICWRRGPGTQGSDWGSGEAAAPWRPISQTCHICPFLSAACTDVRSSHRLPLGREQDRNWESGAALVLLVELGFD